MKRIYLAWLLVIVSACICAFALAAFLRARDTHASAPREQYTFYLPAIAGMAWERGGANCCSPSGVTYTQRCAALRLARVSWFYDWDEINHGNCATAFIPMAWGHTTGTITITDQSTNWLLGFNEPNMGTQANMTPEQAVADWHWLEETGRLLVSPAVYAGTDCPGCGNWLEQWWALCQARLPAPCRVDAIGLHWYGCDVAMLETYLARRAAQFPDLPLWLTEWGCNAAGANQAAYARAALPVIERYAERNAIFALYAYNGHEGLILDGVLTPLGEVYAEAIP